jgi:hypothetical protein
MKTFALICLFVASGVPALADPDVAIDKCVLNYVTKGSDDVLGYGMAFTNNTHHVITAIRVNFIFETQFNEVLGNQLQTDTGEFTPGVQVDHTERDTTRDSALSGGSISLGSILSSARRGGSKEPYWQVANPSKEPISSMKVACELDAVSFQDGTVWMAPQKP